MLPTPPETSVLPCTVYCTLLAGYKFALQKYGFNNSKFLRLIKSLLQVMQVLWVIKTACVINQQEFRTHCLLQPIKIEELAYVVFETVQAILNCLCIFSSSCVTYHINTCTYYTSVCRILFNLIFKFEVFLTKL